MGTTSSENNCTHSYIAFFDLDRTITGVISGRAIAVMAVRKGLMKRYSFMQALLLSAMYKLRLKDPRVAIDQMTMWTKGMNERVFTALCDQAFNEILLPSVFHAARKEINDHKANNARVVILSSSLTPICREMAKSLGMDDFIGSELEIKGNFLTGAATGEFCYGDEKAVRMKEYCEINNTDPSSSWYYGDSISDLAVLSAVGNPVCVNPDRRLKKTALQKGWKILRWNN